MSEGAATNRKLAFVTTGATAPFIALIESVLKPSTLDCLLQNGYTHLLIQYGTAKDVFSVGADTAREYLKQNHMDQKFIIDGIDFDSGGLIDQFKMVMESGGLVISHAGSGTILSALRHQFPLIVVPNTTLLDNHQEELATALQKSGYLLQGNVDDLASAITKSEDFRVKMTQFPPITSGKHRETKSFAAVMDETMGFMD